MAFRQKTNKVITLSGDNFVRSCNDASFISRCLATWEARSTGRLVNRDTTSKETRDSSGRRV